MSGSLRRRLGPRDAVVVGVGSMMGAGVFVAWAPAAGASGTGLLIGLVLAGLVATCNATSSAQLAAVHPESGGTYVYGRQRLGPSWGHLAGWAFVVGKTASCMAMALTVGAYLWPQQHRVVAVLAIVGVVSLNIAGLERTVRVTLVLLAVTATALVLVVIGGWSAGGATLDRITPLGGGPGDWLRAGGFLFFAFAGYARIATLGEEVRDPERSIPWAVPRALAAVLAVYALIGVTLLALVPVELVSTSSAPLRLVVEAGPLDALAPMLRVGAGLASLGVLLNLIPGISRTVLAMARSGELPAALSQVDPRRQSPLVAEISVAAVVLAGVLLVDLRGAIGFSGVTILAYYAITNAAALRLTPRERRWSPVLASVGLVGCVALALALPLTSLIPGLGVLAAGLAVGRLSRPAG